MYYNDHGKPHFHAEYGEYEATVDIMELRFLSGKLPRRAQELVLDWAELHQSELLEDWNLCKEKKPLNQIIPLQ